MKKLPHCYGRMDWILKYPEGKEPKHSICDCTYSKSCLEKTRMPIDLAPQIIAED